MLSTASQATTSTLKISTSAATIPGSTKGLAPLMSQQTLFNSQNQQSLEKLLEILQQFLPHQKFIRRKRSKN
jgi:hypothetical protein